ncbi:MAG TPA: hypothetical protein VKS25_16305 [Solirubrobacteraceae bacterium]|nr:hypothetical protein [Solirubrobacteraceae bacterium]
MHAVVISGTFNDRSAAEAEVPDLTARVSGMPGFVAGYWIALSGGEAHAIIVFETAEGAQALAQAAHGGPSDAVSVTAIKVGEVIGRA